MKKGFMKTVEVVLAALLVSSVLFIATQEEKPLYTEQYLHLAEKNPDFRALAIGCYNSSDIQFMQDYLPPERDYILCIDTLPESLPKRDIVGETIFLADYKVARLFHWLR